MSLACDVKHFSYCLLLLIKYLYNCNNAREGCDSTQSFHQHANHSKLESDSFMGFESCSKPHRKSEARLAHSDHYRVEF